MLSGSTNKLSKSKRILNKRRFAPVSLDLLVSQSTLLVVSDVIRSAIGTLIWVAIIIAWNVTFQTYRTRMGPVGDYLTFVLPRGYY